MHVVGQRSVDGGSSAVSLACIISMCLVQRFLAASLSFGWPLDHSFHSFTPIPPPFYFSSDKSVCQVPGPICVGAHGWKVRVYQGPGVQLVECGVRMIGSDLNRTWRKRGEKNEGRVGRVPSLFHFFSPLFFSSSIFRLRSTI